MDTTIEAAWIGVAGAVIIGFVGWIWLLHDRQVRSDRDLRGEIAALEIDLLKFRAEVAEKYASVPYLKDVEERLLDTISNLGELVEKLRDSITSWHATHPR